MCVGGGGFILILLVCTYSIWLIHVIMLRVMDSHSHYKTHEKYIIQCSVSSPLPSLVVEVNFAQTAYTFQEADGVVELTIEKRGVATKPISINISFEDITAIGKVLHEMYQELMSAATARKSVQQRIIARNSIVKVPKSPLPY